MPPKSDVALADAFAIAADMLDPVFSLDDISRGLQNWREIRRPNQCPPIDPIDWFLWVLLAGRGFGKTATGANWLLDEMTAAPRYWYAMIGPTFDEGRDIMVEGESGLLYWADARKLKHTWNKSLGHFQIKGGARADLFTAEKPDGVRGPNLRALWGDEFATWRYGRQVWETVIWAMRKGDVRALLTGTPQATAFVKEMLSKADVITKGVSEDNRANLSEKYYNQVIKPLEGTRLYRQEALAEILEDVEGALWKQSEIDATRVRSVPSHQEYEDGELVDVADLVELIVVVDPSVTNKGPKSAAGKAQRESDECGILLAGLGSDGHVYIIADWSGRMSTDQWAARTFEMYDVFQADRIVAEVNHGHDLVIENLRGYCRAQGVAIPKIDKINASRGKTVRAQPVQGLYVQGMVHHVGVFAQLEDEQTTWVDSPGARSPNRLDVAVYAVSELLLRRQGRKLGYSIS